MFQYLDEQPQCRKRDSCPSSVPDRRQPHTILLSCELRVVGHKFASLSCLVPVAAWLKIRSNPFAHIDFAVSDESSELGSEFFDAERDDEGNDQEGAVCNIRNRFKRHLWRPPAGVWPA